MSKHQKRPRQQKRPKPDKELEHNDRSKKDNRKVKRKIDKSYLRNIIDADGQVDPDAYNEIESDMEW